MLQSQRLLKYWETIEVELFCLYIAGKRDAPAAHSGNMLCRMPSVGVSNGYVNTPLAARVMAHLSGYGPPLRLPRPNHHRLTLLLLSQENRDAPAAHSGNMISRMPSVSVSNRYVNAPLAAQDMARLSVVAVWRPLQMSRDRDLDLWTTFLLVYRCKRDAPAAYSENMLCRMPSIGASNRYVNAPLAAQDIMVSQWWLGLGSGPYQLKRAISCAARGAFTYPLDSPREGILEIIFPECAAGATHLQ
jgi:hypothetical protein